MVENDGAASQPPRGVRDPAWSVVLILMMGLTCWAVSTVSIWLAPVYIGVMLLLLGPSQEDRPEASGKGEAASASDPFTTAAGDGVAGGSESESSRNGRKNRASETATSGLESAATRQTRPKSIRGRSRKGAVKGGTGAASASVPVTWIRIGPGKFVRSDADPGTSEIVPQQSAAESKTVPGSEAESGFQGIAPSVPDSLATQEPASAPESTVDAEAAPADLAADCAPCVQPDAGPAGGFNVDLVGPDLEFEERAVGAAPESLVDVPINARPSESESRLNGGLRLDGPAPTEESSASRAAEGESASNQDDQIAERRLLVSGFRTDSNLGSSRVPSPRTAPGEAPSNRRRLGRAVRRCDAVDAAPRSRPSRSSPNPLDGALISRARLSNAQNHFTGRIRRIRRGYRPRSPPTRRGIRATTSSRSS